MMARIVLLVIAATARVGAEPEHTRGPEAEHTSTPRPEHTSVVAPQAITETPGKP